MYFLQASNLKSGMNEQSCSFLYKYKFTPSLLSLTSEVREVGEGGRQFSRERVLREDEALQARPKLLPNLRRQRPLQLVRAQVDALHFLQIRQPLRHRPWKNDRLIE